MSHASRHADASAKCQECLGLTRGRRPFVASIGLAGCHKNEQMTDSHESAGAVFVTLAVSVTQMAFNRFEGWAF
jgi:hypothetical protein